MSPLPLMFDLSAGLPLEPAPATLHQAPPYDDPIAPLLRSIRQRLGHTHACHILTQPLSHAGVVPHTSPWWETPWSDAGSISELDPAFRRSTQSEEHSMLEYRTVASALVPPPRALLPPTAEQLQASTVKRLVAEQIAAFMELHGIVQPPPVQATAPPAASALSAWTPQDFQVIIAGLQAAGAVAPPNPVLQRLAQRAQTERP